MMPLLNRFNKDKCNSNNNSNSIRRELTNINNSNNNQQQQQQQPTSIIDRLSKELKNKKRQKKEVNVHLSIQMIKNVFYLICNILFYSLYLLSIKILFYLQTLNMNQVHITSSVVLFFIGFYQVLLSSLLMKVDHLQITKPKVFNKSEVDELILRGVFEFVNNIFLVLSLSHMRLASAVTIFFLSPIIRTFMYLKQKMDPIENYDKLCYICSLLVCLIFVLQVVYKENFKDNFKGTCYSIITAISMGISSLSERKTCNEFHPYIISFVVGLFGVSICPLWMSVVNADLDIGCNEVMLFTFCGICFFFKFYYEQKYLQLMQNTMSFSNNYFVIIIIGYLFGMLVLGEAVTVIDVVASLIAILVNYYSQIRLELSENQDD